MNGEILKNILVIVGTWITAIITYKLTSKNDKSKLLSTQFKQQGIEKQKKLLKLWTICAQNGYENFILSLESEYDKKHRLEDKTELIKLYMNDVVLYTSKETMRLFAIFMQNAYKSSKTQKINGMKTIYVAYKIMSCMKYDFTGEKIKTIDLIKIKINDLDIKKKAQLKFYEIYYSKLISYMRFWE